MPTYAYTCKNCDHSFDAVQRFSDDALVTCPACGQDTLRKVYHATGIIFKGTGWYVTDSRSKNPTVSNGKDGDKASKSEPAKPASDSSSKTSEPAKSSSAAVSAD